MEDIYRNLGTINYWGKGTASQKNSFGASELWLDQSTGVVANVQRTIQHTELDNWLRPAQDENRTLLVRLAFANIDIRDRLIDLSMDIRTRLVDAFGLDLAHRYAQSCLSGATALPPQVSHDGTETRAFCFCYTPKLAIMWSHKRYKEGSVTQGIVFAQSEEDGRIQDAMKRFKWELDVCRSAMFPAFLVSIVLGEQIDTVTGKIKGLLRSVEKKSGHHLFASRFEADVPTELSELSMKINGSAAKLASTLRKAKSVEKLLVFMLKALDTRMTQLETRKLGISESTDHGSINAEVNGCTLLKHHVSVLQDRQEMQAIDIEHTVKRVQVQIEALFSIIQQKDTLHNIKLATATHAIAYFSYRDSSSMKTLAVVTMFFLPGSFISALFSTPCFDWDTVDKMATEIGVKPTPQFSLYWAITIPLTVLTFLLYFLWLYFQKKERDRLFAEQEMSLNEEQEGKAEIEGQLQEAEGHILAKSRETILEKARTRLRNTF